MNYKFLFFPVFIFITCSCNNDNDDYIDVISAPNVEATFGSNIDLNNLANYANQAIPGYIRKDNSIFNPITDRGATLGRVLFYDTNLSSNNTTSCATCHIQDNAFSDSEIVSSGANSTTGRHSMRLINSRFSVESKFFWDERAASLEIQTTMPIKDHGEMGFSGENGDLSFNDLITRLEGIGYYKELFHFVFGSEEISEAKIQFVLAQFIRSIQSFDSKYDAGRALAANDNQPFLNFTNQENLGKNLFLTPPQFDGNGSRTGGGVGCAGCHAAPEFDIDPNTLNNGVINVISNNSIVDITNTRAPSLRDITKANGTLNSQFMHAGNLNTIQDVLSHYNSINVVAENTNLDPRLKPNGNGQQLNMTNDEKNALQAFLITLGGTNVYTDSKWSNPFN